MPPRPISIDSTNNTLSGIATAINSAPNNPGVTASVITTTAGARLVITGTVTGAANSISVSETGGDGGLASLVYPPSGTTGLTQTQAADGRELFDQRLPGDQREQRGERSDQRRDARLTRRNPRRTRPRP